MKTTRKAPAVKLPTDDEIAHGREIGWHEHWFDAARLNYRPRKDEHEIELVNNLRVTIPRRMIFELAELPPAVAKQMRLGVQGGAIEVRSEDIDVSIRGLLRDLVGANIARRGGSARTPAKATAARENGRLGGRPRKEPVAPKRIKKKERIRAKQAKARTSLNLAAR